MLHTTVVSLEAILLSTLVLVSQNRESQDAEQRAELDIQINLLSEYEITSILSFVDAIAKKVEADVCDDAELRALEEDVKPTKVRFRTNGKEMKPAKNVH